MEGLTPEFIDASPILTDSDSDGPGKAELRVHMRDGFCFSLYRMTKPPGRKSAHLCSDLLHVFCPNPLAIQIEGTVRYGSRETATGMHLDTRVRHFPLFPQGFGDPAVVILILERKGLDKPTGY